MLTHANLRFAAQASARLRGIVPEDRIYGALPLTHVFGLASMLMASSFAGASVQLEVRFRPDRVYTALMNGVTVFPGMEIRLDTAVGSASDADTGEILTRGPQVMKGYFKNPAETARVIDTDGWLRTGDLGKIDTQGNLHVVGRCKELIIRGGFNVYPPEVEAALNDHPDVIQSAVIGRTLDNGDEEILAFVQCVDPDALDPAMLATFVSERLVSYKCPSRIITCTELPAAATGKVLKHKLLSTFTRQLLDT